MNKKVTGKAIVLGIATLPILVNAQEKDSASELEQIVVVSFQENSIDSTLNNVNTIKLNGISDPSIVDISSALEKNTSIGLMLDGNGNTKYINIRGLGENYTEVTIDGIKKPGNFSYAHGIYNSGELNSFETDSIAEIDIVKGHNSPKQGGGALAGSINMRTYRPSDFVNSDKPFYASVKSGYASKNKSWGNTLTGAMSNGNFDTMVMYTKRNTHELSNQGDDENETKRNKINYDQNNLLLKGEMRIANGRFIATAERFEQKRKTSPRYSSDDAKDEPVKRSRLSLEGEFENFIGLDSFNSRISYQKTSNRSQGMYVGYFKNEYLNGSFDAVKNINVGAVNQNILFGMGYTRTNFDFKRKSRTGVFDRRTPITIRKNSYAYVKDNIGFSNGLIVSPGLRIEHEKHTSKVDDIYLNNPGVTLQGFIPKTSKTSIMPSLGLTMPINDTTKVFANYSYGGKSADEINFVSYGYSAPGHNFAYIPNLNLKDETSKNLELGFSYQQKDNFNIAVNAFYTKYDNFVIQKQVNEYNGLTGNFLIPENLRKVKTYGLEVDSRFVINDSLNASVGFTWMKGTRQEKGSDSSPLLNLSPFTANLGLNYSHGKVWGAGLSVRLASKGQKAKEQNLFRTSGYGVANLTGWWKPMKGMTISGGVYNVFDKTYWSASEVNGSYFEPVSQSKPGRNFAATFKYEF